MQLQMFDLVRLNQVLDTLVPLKQHFFTKCSTIVTSDMWDAVGPVSAPSRSRQEQGLLSVIGGSSCELTCEFSQTADLPRPRPPACELK